MGSADVLTRPLEHPACGRVRRATLYESATAPGPRGSAVAVVHGLFAHRGLPEIDAVCRGLARDHDVVAVDLRGHGDASGWFTWGREETGELADLVAFLHMIYPVVGVLGFSLGGSIAIVSAALAGVRDDRARPEAICTIGAPAHLDLWRFRFRPFGFLRHARLILARRRRLARLGWPRRRWARAADAAGAVSPALLLVVHGDRDWLVDPGQARLIYEAASPPRELLLLQGGLHAEYMVAQDPGMVLEPVRRFFARSLLEGGAGDAVRRPEVRLGRGRG